MEMTRDSWELLIFVPNGVPSVRARCCETMIWYERPGDEWCDEHRCMKVSSYGKRCSRKSSYAGLCGQHFSRELRNECGI